MPSRNARRWRWSFAGKGAGQPCLEPRGRQSVPKDSPNHELLGLDGQCFLYLQPIRRIIHDKVEVLDEHSQRQRRLLPRERPADAAAHACAKGAPRMGIVLHEAVKLVVCHSLGVEFPDVGAVGGAVEVGFGQQAYDLLACLDGVLAANHLVLDGLAGKGWNGRTVAERLSENLITEKLAKYLVGCLAESTRVLQRGT